MAIIEDGQATPPPAVCNCTEKCKTGEVNTTCPVCSVTMNNCTGKEAEPEAPAEPEKPKKSMSGLLIFACCGTSWRRRSPSTTFKFMKSKQSVKGGTDLDEFDFDEYDETSRKKLTAPTREQEDEDE